MKKTLYMIILLIAACAIGGLIGNIATGYWAWLGKTFGIDFQPGNFLRTDVISLTFGVTFQINIAQIILILVAILVFYKTAPKLISGK